MPPKYFPFSPQVPIMLSPNVEGELNRGESATLAGESATANVKDPEFLPPEGGQLSPPDLLLRRQYVHHGEGRPLALKDARRDPQYGQKVPIAIEESLVSPMTAHLETASAIFPPGSRTS